MRDGWVVGFWGKEGEKGQIGRGVRVGKGKEGIMWIYRAKGEGKMRKGRKEGRKGKGGKGGG